MAKKEIIGYIPKMENYLNLTPFKVTLIQNFPFLNDDFDSLTNIGFLDKVIKNLNDVIANENIVKDNTIALYNAFVNLRNYVQNYFNNLDVQDEINNKLDEMSQNGDLVDLITAFLTTKAVLCFDTISDLRLSTNLSNGSYVKTLGYHSINDGGNAMYKIRNKTNNDIDNRETLHFLQNNLVAELCYNNTLQPEVFGAYGDNIHNDTSIIQDCIDYASINKCKILLTKKYIIKPTISTPEVADRKVALFLKSNLIIEGLGTNTGFILDDTNIANSKYWAGFYSYSNIQHENIIFRNFEIYQNATTLSKMGINQFNPRYIFCFYSLVKNLTIDNVSFNNIHSVDTIMLNNDTPGDNIKIVNCTFKFKSILNAVDYYDCSIIYLRTANAIFNNNELYGDNMACVGGLEMHGFNIIAKNNIIEEFQDCINVVPTYNNKNANLVIESNTLRGYEGIVFWDNKSGNAISGCDNIRILNNDIKIECSADGRLAGISTTDASFNFPIENILIKNNKINFINIGNEITMEPAFSGGINFNREVNMKNIIIDSNIISNSPSSGIQLGTTNSSAEITLEDIIISNNIVKNSGLKDTAQISYNSAIFMGFRYFKNCQIINNILDNTIENIGSKYAFACGGFSVEGFRNYFRNNIVSTINENLMTFTDGKKVFPRETISQKIIEGTNGTLYKLTINNSGELVVTEY